MIAHVKGHITEKAPTRVVVDVNGIGYQLLIPVSTFDALPNEGETAKLLTYQHVREDQLLLFGFATPKEKWMFAKLISVSGIGPKLALGVLSGCPIDRLAGFIVNGDVDLLCKLPGIGKKTAQRLNLELRDKLGDVSIGLGESSFVGAGSLNGNVDEAILALVSLGLARGEAERSVSRLLADQPDMGVDELVKRALQKS